MQQLLSIWTGLDPRRRVIAVLGTLAMLVAVFGLSRMATTPGQALLYAGLEPGSAGEVIQALDQRSVAYEIRGDAIYVPERERDALRMTLAGEGLPANSSQGYELLDSLSGFGTTAQMFDAAYWRAKEGELARTIVSSPDIRTARVHISNPSSNPFQREIRPTASVSATSASGPLTAARAKALRYLVASAVAGMDPGEVSVIDAMSGMVITGDDAAGDRAGGDRAAELRRNIQRMLEARVGPGNVVVEVSVDTENQQESITERRFDPDGRVAISTETAEHTTSSTETGSGAVTVASNLPDGPAGGGDSSARSEDSETREVVNFEVSETRREILRTPGAIRRISVAVLVDGQTVTDPATGVPGWQPRPEDELAALRELVASAVGFEEARGDTITLKSMEFRPVTLPPPNEAAGLQFFANLDPMRLIQLAVLALVTLALGLFVVRPVLKSGPAMQLPPPTRTPLAVMREGVVTAPATGAAGAAAAPMSAPQMSLSGEIEDAMPGRVANGSPGNALPRPDLPGSGDTGTGPGDPVARLRELIEQRREETVEILRSWMEDSEEHS